MKIHVDYYLAEHAAKAILKSNKNESCLKLLFSIILWNFNFSRVTNGFSL